VTDRPAALADPPPTETGRRFGSVEVLAVLLVLLVIFRNPLAGLISGARLQTWTTVFVSVLVQAVPFLVFGVAGLAADTWLRVIGRYSARTAPDEISQAAVPYLEVTAWQEIAPPRQPYE